MMNKRTIFLSLAALSATALLPVSRAEDAPARPIDKPPRSSGEEPERRGPSNPLVAALDTNRDGTVDETELAAAPVSLKKLDLNNDGKLTPDEMRPARRERVTAPDTADKMTKRLMAFDKDGNGKLSKEELPDRMRPILERGDTDKDGYLSKEEIGKVSATSAKAPAATQHDETGEAHDRD